MFDVDLLIVAFSAMELKVFEKETVATAVQVTLRICCRRSFTRSLRLKLRL